MARLRVFALLSAASLYATSAGAWGDDGHRIVGEIAAHYLSPAAEARVNACLTDVAYPTLADAAVWADAYAKNVSTYQWANPLHYVNVPVEAAAFSEPRDCPHGCVVSAIRRFLQVLREPGDDLAARSRRREALYFVAHFVGDLHQPLHITHPDGRGGNATQVLFFGEQRRAHWLWDDGLFQRHEPLQSLKAAGTRDAWKHVAFDLRMRLDPRDVQRLQASLEPEAWANETLVLAKQHALLRASQTVDDAYVRRKWPIVERQLQRAGVRLAAVLNAAFENTRPAMASDTSAPSARAE